MTDYPDQYRLLTKYHLHQKFRQADYKSIPIWNFQVIEMQEALQY
jgi:hypothetical protein